jgi:uncharacterized protein Yka (UPF0111/DUF47 family)
MPISVENAKRKLREAQQELSEAEGALKSLMKNLKNEYGVSTIPEARKKMKEMEKEAEKLKQDLAKHMDEVEEILSDTE